MLFSSKIYLLWSHVVIVACYFNITPVYYSFFSLSKLSFLFFHFALSFERPKKKSKTASVLN